MSEILEGIAPALAKTARERHLTVIEEKCSAQAFGNANVDLSADKFDLGVVRDRGQVFVDVRAKQGRWLWLHEVISYLDLGTHNPREIPSIEWLAEKLTTHWDAIAEFMASERLAGFILHYRRNSGSDVKQ